MSFPRYPKYRDSGIEWLGEVPEHWSVAAVRRVVRRIEQGWSPECLARAAEPHEWGVLKSGCVNGGAFSEGENKALPDALTPVADYEVKPGDLLVSRASGSPDLVGSAAVVCGTRPGLMLSDKIFRLRLHRFVEPRFVALALSSVPSRTQIQRAISGADGLANNLPQSALKSLLLAIPPVAEQQGITAFLERETAANNALIAEQERLIALLKEKRQALISHVVTKGLNPEVPRKPSRLPWMGEIPKHWGVVQSRRLFRVRNEPALPSDQQLTASQKYGMVLQKEFVELEGRRVVEVIQGTDALRHAEPNDFVISLRSFQGGLELCKVAGSVTFHYVVLVPVIDVHCPFFAYLFKSAVYIQALRATANLIRDGQDLRYSHFVQVGLPQVPLDQQVEIAEHLDREAARIDALLREAQSAVRLLRERRAALITAAVTGQIDVRRLVPRDVPAVPDAHCVGAS